MNFVLLIFTQYLHTVLTETEIVFAKETIHTYESCKEI